MIDAFYADAQYNRVSHESQAARFIVRVTEQDCLGRTAEGVVHADFPTCSQATLFPDEDLRFYAISLAIRGVINRLAATEHQAKWNMR